MQLCRSQTERSSWGFLMGPGEMGSLSAGVCWWRISVSAGVSRQCSIRDGEQEINQIFSDTWIQREPDSPAVLKEGQAKSVLIGLQNGDSNDGEGWKPGTFGNGRKASAFPEHVQLQNRLSALVADDWLRDLCNEPWGSTRREQQKTAGVISCCWGHRIP